MKKNGLNHFGYQNHIGECSVIDRYEFVLKLLEDFHRSQSRPINRLILSSDRLISSIFSSSGPDDDGCLSCLAPRPWFFSHYVPLGRQHFGSIIPVVSLKQAFTQRSSLRSNLFILAPSLLATTQQFCHCDHPAPRGSIFWFFDA